MSKELTLKDHSFPIQNSDNCFAETVATISGLTGSRNFDGIKLSRALPKYNNGYLTNLFILLQEHDLAPLAHDVIAIKPDSHALFLPPSKTPSSAAPSVKSVLPRSPGSRTP